MKTLLAATLFAAATQVCAQALEADLDGNAGALQASELRPQPQPAHRPVQAAPQPQSKKAQRQRLAARQ
jgi:hypothetical protein